MNALLRVLPLLLSLGSGGCLHHLNLARSEALSTPDADVYLSSAAYPDGNVRRRVIERVGPVVGRCEQVEVDVFEYRPDGELALVLHEERACGMVVRATRWECGGGVECRGSTAIDLDRDGRPDVITPSHDAPPACRASLGKLAAK